MVRWFDGYLRAFADGRGALAPLLQLKVEHSRRVAAIMGGLGRDLGLARGEVAAAWTLGLLHDVGRFSQFAQFGTLNDRRSLDHGRRGAEVLEQHRILRGCAPAERRRILAGVRHHNGRRLPGGLRAGELLFVRLIRDADKLDIFETLVAVCENGEVRRRPELVFNVPLDGPPSPAAAADLRAGRIVSYAHVRSLADFFLTMLSWVYDLNFSATCRRLAERGLLEKILAALPPDREIRAAAAVAMASFERRLRPPLRRGRRAAAVRGRGSRP